MFDSPGFTAAILSYILTPASAVSTAGNVLDGKTNNTLIKTIGKILQVSSVCLCMGLVWFPVNPYFLFPIIPAVISFSIDAAMAISKKKNLKDVENIFSKIYLTAFKVLNIAVMLIVAYHAIWFTATLPFALVNIAFLAIQLYTPVKNLVNKAIEYHHIIEEHKKSLAEHS